MLLVIDRRLYLKMNRWEKQTKYLSIPSIWHIEKGDYLVFITNIGERADLVKSAMESADVRDWIVFENL